MRVPGLFAALIVASSCGDLVPPATGQEPGAGASTGREIIDALTEQRQVIETASDGEGMDTAAQFVFDGLIHDTVPLAAFAGKAVLVVNTASECGFTPQYADLQQTYETYKDEGLVVVGVPSNDFGGQEPGSEKEIEAFCRLNYGVTFPMTAKYSVRGDAAHPFYVWARRELGRSAEPRWNFHKILIGRDGLPAGAFPSRIRPSSPTLVSAIEEALAAPAPQISGG